jgi:hypothetical protein
MHFTKPDKKRPVCRVSEMHETNASIPTIASRNLLLLNNFATGIRLKVRFTGM